MYSRLKWRMYDVVRDDGEYNRVNSIISSIIMILIVINVFVIILETFDFPDWAMTVFYYIEFVSVIVFTVEYLLRPWTSTCKYPDMNPFRARLKYARSFMAVIDILAVLPFYLPFAVPVNLMVLRMLRLLRLLRIMKMNRYTNALTSIKDVLIKQAPQLVSSMSAVLMMMVLASLLVYSVEHDAQPHVFENAFSGLWWAMATLTTVGYGDITPITWLGKLLGAIIALLGIGLVAVPTGIISAGFIDSMTKANEAEKEAAKEAKHFCPYCGKKID